MAYHKSLKKGEHLTLSGAATITAVSNCKLMIEAEDDVVIDGLEWRQITIDIGYGASFSAYGKHLQTYVCDDGMAIWGAAMEPMQKLYEGDNPKAACEAHNKVWNGE